MKTVYQDKKIIEDLKSTDERRNNLALTHLYETNYVMACDIIKRRGGNNFWVQEIFQDAIITLYESIKADKFNQQSSIRTFLYSIIRNKWMATLQRIQQNEKLNFQFAEGQDDLYQMPEPNNRHLISIYLKDILEKIGDPCKQLLIHYYYDKMSLKEITEVMNYTTEKSVKSQKFKCIQRLIEYVEQKTNIKYILSELL